LIDAPGAFYIGVGIFALGFAEARNHERVRHESSYGYYVPQMQSAAYLRFATPRWLTVDAVGIVLILIGVDRLLEG
jgi:hypothetical protein